MAETISTWVILFASGVAVIFCALILQDLWRQRRHRRNTNIKPPSVSHRSKRTWRPPAQGYDYPELFLEDIEVRFESDDKATETKTQV